MSQVVSFQIDIAVIFKVVLVLTEGEWLTYDHLLNFTTPTTRYIKTIYNRIDLETLARQDANCQQTLAAAKHEPELIMVGEFYHPHPGSALQRSLGP